MAYRCSRAHQALAEYVFAARRPEFAAYPLHRRGIPCGAVAADEVLNREPASPASPGDTSNVLGLMQALMRTSGTTRGARANKVLGLRVVAERAWCANHETFRLPDLLI